jgi:hypothetical protein
LFAQRDGAGVVRLHRENQRRYRRTGTIFVKPNGPTIVSLVLEGAVHYVILTLTTAYPVIGHPAAIGLTPILQDFDQNLIVGPAPYEHPVTLTTSDSANGPLSKTTLNSPADAAGITANYNGAKVASITYSATATGLDPGNVTGFVLAAYSVNASPHLYLTVEASDTCNGGGLVSVFDLANVTKAPTNITCGGLISPLGVAVDAAGKLYVSNNALMPGNTINVFDTTHGYAVLPPISGPGLGGSQRMTVGPNGKLYVADAGANSVDIFDIAHDNAELPSITGGGLNLPFDVTLDTKGKLFVANAGDGGGGSISVFDTAHGNAVLPAITGNGMQGPWGLAIDSSGKLYVTSENGPSVVAVFDTAHGNAPLPTITGGGLAAPMGIALDAGGKLYVVNLGFPISVFDTLHGDAALPPIGAAGLDGAESIAIH